MANITKYMGEGCTKKKECYRYIAECSPFQSYSELELPCFLHNYEFFMKQPISEPPKTPEPEKFIEDFKIHKTK